MSNKSFIRINNQIKTKEVRIVSDNVEKGVYSLSDALELSKNLDLDLLEINPNVYPSICKIMDYKKYQFEQKKKIKEQKKKQKENRIDVKEMRFGPNTDEHDFNFKKNHIEKFLKNGDKVKAYVFFKGRELQYKDKGEIILLRIADELKDICVVENLPKLQGNKMIMILKPKK